MMSKYTLNQALNTKILEIDTVIPSDGRFQLPTPEIQDIDGGWYRVTMIIQKIEKPYKTRGKTITKPRLHEVKRK